MANRLAVGFQFQFWSDGSSGYTFDLREYPVCFFFPQAAGFTPNLAPLVSETFDLTKLIPQDFRIGQYDTATYEGLPYVYFTPTSNGNWTLDGYQLTLTGTWGTTGALNLIVGMLLF
jgi:hypothetical protein